MTDNGWIKVEDGLPEPSQLVLFYTINSHSILLGWYRATGGLNEDGSYWHAHGDNFKLSSDVSRWQPVHPPAD